MPMPTSLRSGQTRLVNQLRYIDAGFDRHLTNASLGRRFDRSAIREGLVSALWQAWSRFVRFAILESAKGALTDAGGLTTSTYSARSEAEILYVAKQLSLNQKVKTIKSLSHHQEPSWGDISKSIQIASNITISNSTTILSALSIPLAVPDLQICRNASAHLTTHQMAQLAATRVRYNNTKMSHPSDAALWIDPSSGGFLWKTWVDEIILSSDYACR